MFSLVANVWKCTLRTQGIQKPHTSNLVLLLLFIVYEVRLCCFLNFIIACTSTSINSCPVYALCALQVAIESFGVLSCPTVDPNIMLKK